MKHFLIFGAHPLLSLAEAKAVIGGRKPELAGEMAIFEAEDWDGQALNDRLGGTVKLGDIIAEFSVKDLTIDCLADEIGARPRGKKVEFGLTVYGGSVGARQKRNSLAISFKRVLRERGYKVRWVTGEKGDLTPAAVAKAHLIDQGYDFCIGLMGQKAVIGLTTHVQDADTWSLRDYGRPFRDAKTGMLPPKLARMMVNISLAVRSQQSEIRNRTLLDPFCGAGTVLMEAGLAQQITHNLRRTTVIGSDIDTRQVEGAKKNLDWLVRKKLLDVASRKNITLFVSDVRALASRFKDQKVDTIVTEGYLGQPLRGHESVEFLKKQKREIEALWREALKVFSHIQSKGGRIVCIWPVFVSGRDTVVVDLKEDVQKFGYKIIDPLESWLDKPVTLTYARPDQRVKRNLVVLEKVEGKIEDGFKAWRRGESHPRDLG